MKKDLICVIILFLGFFTKAQFSTEGSGENILNNSNSIGAWDSTLISGTCYADNNIITYFNVENNGGNVVINWQTNSEIQNDYFLIQASKDGFLYQNIGKIKGLGNTDALTYYQFIDEYTTSNITYYRLKQVCFDDKTFYSAVKLVDRGIKKDKFVMYPNPAVNQFSISDLREGTNTMNIYSLNGHHVITRSITNYSILDLTIIDTGIYIVSITNYLGTSSQKLVVR